MRPYFFHKRTSFSLKPFSISGHHCWNPDDKQDTNEGAGHGVEDKQKSNQAKYANKSASFAIYAFYIMWRGQDWWDLSRNLRVCSDYLAEPERDKVSKKVGVTLVKSSWKVARMSNRLSVFLYQLKIEIALEKAQLSEFYGHFHWKFNNSRI